MINPVNNMSLRLILRSVIVLSALMFLCPEAGAQFSQAKLESLRDQLRLLESTQADVVSVLSAGSFESTFLFDNPQSFYRDDETVDVSYATGKCEYDDYEFMPLDAWNVPKGTVVSIEIEPKDRLSAKDLGFDLRKLKKERPFRPQKNYLVYFDKELGIAIYMWRDIVRSIRLFPSRRFESKLCKSDAIRRYFRSDKWRFRPEPKGDYSVDFNLPASVVEVRLTEVEHGRFGVEVKAEDQENDVLTYNYRVSAGRIVGVGSRVVWDLRGAPPGTHTITAAVDDGIGIRGRYLTKSVRLD